MNILKSKRNMIIAASGLSLTIISSLVFFLFIKKDEENLTKSSDIPTPPAIREEKNENQEKKEEEHEKEIVVPEQQEHEVTKKEAKKEAKEQKQEKNGIYSLTILVNKDNPVPSNLVIKTTMIDNIPVDERISAPLNNMIQAAYDEGIHLGLCSGYRNSNFQKMLYEREVERFKKSGMNDKRAREEASKNVAEPGKSEHECGLAVDFYSYSDKNANLDDAFENTLEGKFAKRVASKYGFILRYPRGKEHITKYSYEPWHFRYVGTPLAEKITNSGLTFEEYHKKYLQ